jgi:hypothetical protein
MSGPVACTVEKDGGTDMQAGGALSSPDTWVDSVRACPNHVHVL